jgi:hypothetical protein
MGLHKKSRACFLDIYTKSEPGAVATGSVRISISSLSEKVLMVSEQSGRNHHPTRAAALPGRLLVPTSCDYTTHLPQPRTILLCKVLVHIFGLETKFRRPCERSIDMTKSFCECSRNVCELNNLICVLSIKVQNLTDRMRPVIKNGNNPIMVSR